MGRVTDTISGGLATFRTPGKQQIRSLKAYFTPKQEGEGTPSPDNVRPITGWTGVNVERRGKNLFDAAATPYQTGRFVGAASSVGSAPTYNVHANYNTYAIAVKSGVTYCVANIKASDPCTCLVDGDGIITYIRRNQGGTAGTTFTVTAGQSDALLLLSVGINSTYKCDDVLQVSVGSTSSAYESYNGTTLPIDWSSAGTVYGGYVDLVTGEVWETHHKLVVDETTRVGYFPWGGIKTDSTTGTEYATALFIRSSNDPRARNIASNLCDKLPYSTNQSKINVAYMYDGDSFGAALSLPTSVIGTTQETLKQYLTGNPFTFIYMLREPVLVTTLTPTELRTLIGTNDIWCNSGDVSVEYDFAESREMQEARKRVMAFDTAKRNELYPVGTDVIGLYYGRDEQGRFIGERGVDIDTYGNFVSGSLYGNPTYIAINPSYQYQKSNNRVYHITFYDSDYGFISQIIGNTYNNLNIQEITNIPQNARYMRLCSHGTADANWKLTITRIA